ncbi:MAG: response regulator transcription factor [Bacteroidetes bacterium]|nr:response regulator transcription factor [Bacteroidota bacterium]
MLPEEDKELWVVEDDSLYRKTIAELLQEVEGIRCEHAYSRCEDALRALDTEPAPDVILMDVGLPGMNGIEGTKRVRELSPATRVIILTIHEDDEKVFDALCAGASGYLLKSSPPGEIARAMLEVLKGGAPINAQIARKVLTMFTHLAGPRSPSPLTQREGEILKLMVEGLTKKQIAGRLILSYHTIDTHIKNIYAKLQVHTRTGAVTKALNDHLL